MHQLSRVEFEIDAGPPIQLTVCWRRPWWAVWLPRRISFPLAPLEALEISTALRGVVPRRIVPARSIHADS